MARKSAERKTKVNAASVDDFIDGQKSEHVRDHCRAKAEMWGDEHRRFRPLYINRLSDQSGTKDVR